MQSENHVSENRPETSSENLRAHARPHDVTSVPKDSVYALGTAAISHPTFSNHENGNMNGIANGNTNANGNTDANGNTNGSSTWNSTGNSNQTYENPNPNPNPRIYSQPRKPKTSQRIKNMWNKVKTKFEF